MPSFSILYTALLLFLDLFPKDPVVTPGKVLHMWCKIKSNKCNETSADIKFVFEFSNRTKIPVHESYVIVINTTVVELKYPDIQLHFRGAVISCQWCSETDTDSLYVGCKCLSPFLLCLLVSCM